MIIVTGSVLAKAGRVTELMTISLEHVHRSRAEPGCVSHAVHIDAENSDRLVFLEEWIDMPSLLAHFAVPASRAFVAAVSELVCASPLINVYEANAVPMKL